MKKISLFIDGMHCINCANSIKRTALKIGVKEANISFVNKKGEFIVDDDFSLAKLEYNIKKLGFSVAKSEIKTTDSLKFLKLIITSLASIICLIDFSFNISFVFATLAFIASFDFFKRVVFNKSYGMDLLVSLGIFINYFYSFYSPHHYFFESSFVAFIITLGKFIENYAKAKANSYIKAPKLPFVRLVNNTKIIPNEVKKGDILLFNSEEEIVSDGILLSESAIVNESVITGESLNIAKVKGDKILAGSINVGGDIKLQASNDYYDSSLEKIKDLAISSSSKDIKAFSLLEYLSRIFVLVICIIAAITFVIWYLNAGLEKAFFYTSSVLLISCPCALGLAVPMVVVIAINLCFKNRIILKNPELISEIKNMDNFVFDKTGTLSKNIQKLSHNLSPNDYDLIASIENKINHPIAKSIVKNATNIYDIEGKISLENNILSFKNESLDIKIIPNENELNCYKNGDFIGSIKLENELNENAKELINYLKSLNKNIIILSGDSKARVEELANILGIKDFYYRKKPEEKASIIKELKNSVFVGDGANDIAALKSANFGISFANANAVAKSKADAILLENNLINIKKLFLIFDKSFKKIKQNLAISFIYNFVGISLASGVFSGVNMHLNPALCAFLMSLSSLCVIFNSLLLFKDDNY